MPELKVLLSRETIAKRVAELGEEIARDFGGQSIIFVGVLKGAAIFLSDLARQIPLDSTFDFIGVSSYGNRPSAKEDPAGHAAWDSLGEVRLTKDLDQFAGGPKRNSGRRHPRHRPDAELHYEAGAGASTKIAAHCGLARQAFAPQAADPGAIHRLHHSRCLRSRLRPGLCRTLPQSSGHLRAGQFVIGDLYRLLESPRFRFFNYQLQIRISNEL